ncbi:MAG TPA: NAD-dependent epimerase/dehydratase family protein [Thermoplasmata archaeon]|nr:NAD-dependent epimerase/dehydratase family protein [Thermoplasmata archaeon]
MVTVGVTGATGFVGGALMAYLRGRGHRVIGVDDRSGPVQVEWPDLPVTRGDIRSTATLALLDTADVVLHLAAVSGVMACAEHPAESAAVNVEATDDLAHHLSGRKIPLAFASSFAVVGIPDALPITERTPAKPPHEYARQKAAGEAAVARWARESGVNAAVLRMSNIYGRYEVGGKVVAKGNVLNRFAEQAAAGHLSVNAPGTQRRD